jgi:hypothetical protein
VLERIAEERLRPVRSIQRDRDPRSSQAARIRSNVHIFDFSLSAEQMSVLDTLDEMNGTGRAH